MATPIQANAMTVQPFFGAPFRIASKSILLTYAQCEEKKETLLEFLLDLVPPPQYVVVAEEKHQDGTGHLHAFLNYDEKLLKKNAGPWLEFKKHKVNILPCKFPLLARKYVMKDENYLEHGMSKEIWDIVYYRNIWD